MQYVVVYTIYKLRSVSTKYSVTSCLLCNHISGYWSNVVALCVAGALLLIGTMVTSLSGAPALALIGCLLTLTVSVLTHGRLKIMSLLPSKSATWQSSEYSLFQPRSQLITDCCIEAVYSWTLSAVLLYSSLV